MSQENRLFIHNQMVAVTSESNIDLLLGKLRGVLIEREALAREGIFYEVNDPTFISKMKRFKELNESIRSILKLPPIIYDFPSYKQT